ncbi:hypothetical protein PIB30_001753 [Stylosanthes scabra]|uniref:Uncharacterized protein n=1 Tax=Stylosanthes scabra TaxID=79078 RepID=A0ABU6V4A5_9FABA|nr:hypothetical protein [Stylosanthes scabra]
MAETIDQDVQSNQVRSDTPKIHLLKKRNSSWQQGKENEKRSRKEERERNEEGRWNGSRCTLSSTSSPQNFKLNSRSFEPFACYFSKSNEGSNRQSESGA